MNTKAEAIQMIQDLPEDATLDDIFDQLYLMEKIHRGMKAVEEGRVIPHEEIKMKVEEWKKVSWTEPVVEDLRDLHRYIARDSIRHANRFLDRVIEAAENVTLFPESGRVVAAWRGEAIRQTLCNGYRVLYYSHGGTCNILGVVHGQRDLRRWLKERDESTGL